MTLSLAMITCDTTAPLALATWWAEALGGQLVDPYDGTYVLVVGGPVTLACQLVDDPTPGKNRLHLDLSASDPDAEVDRLVASGATLVERRGDDDFRWVTLADPDGNEFCVASQAHAEAALT